MDLLGHVDIGQPGRGTVEDEGALEKLLSDSGRFKKFYELAVKFLKLSEELQRLTDVGELARNSQNLDEVEAAVRVFIDAILQSSGKQAADNLKKLFQDVRAHAVSCEEGHVRDKSDVPVGEAAVPRHGLPNLDCYKSTLLMVLDETIMKEMTELEELRAKEEGKHLWIIEKLDWEELIEWGIDKLGEDLLEATDEKKPTEVRRVIEEALDKEEKLRKHLRLIWVLKEFGRIPLIQILCSTSRKRTRLFFELLVLTGYGEFAILFQALTGAEVTERCIGFAITKGYVDTFYMLLEKLPKWKENGGGEKFICMALKTGQKSVVKVLLDSGASLKDSVVFNKCLEQTVEDGYLDCVQILLKSVMIPGSEISISSLAQLAAKKGHRDLYRYLLTESKSFCSEEEYKLALSYKAQLPLSDIVDYLMTGQAEERRHGTGYVILDQRFLHTDEIALLPGYGDVRRIPGTITQKCSEFVEKIIRESFLLNKIEKYKVHPIRVMRCGSSGEGTKVGLPDEIDYQLLLETDPLTTDMQQFDRTHGYKKVDLHEEDNVNTIQRLVSANCEIFHNVLVGIFMTQERHQDEIISAEKIVRIGGSATAEWTIRYKIDADHSFDISVDRVPVLHIKNWPPEKGHWETCSKSKLVMETWRMDELALKEEGYALVAKPPHRYSQLAKEFQTWQLQRMWRMSFGHLETMHLAGLEQRVKDVYLTCKSLRDPDICRIIFKDSKGMYMSMSKDLITSHMLKMVFMHNVDEFLSTPKCLVEMVYMVYSQLAQCIEEWFVPLYWNPEWNQLVGLKHDSIKGQCSKAAKIMEAMATARFLRDGGSNTVVLEAGYSKTIGVYPHLPSRGQSPASKSHDDSITDGDDCLEVLAYSRNASREVSYSVFPVG